MQAKDRRFIHGIARKERAIRSLESGDHIRVSARYGEFAGHIEEVIPGNPGDGNHIVVVNAMAYNRDAINADTHTVTIDFEGAFESEYEYYAPYIVATADERSLKEVGRIVTESSDEIIEA